MFAVTICFYEFFSKNSAFHNRNTTRARYLAFVGSGSWFLKSWLRSHTQHWTLLLFHILEMLEKFYKISVVIERQLGYSYFSPLASAKGYSAPGRKASSLDRTDVLSITQLAYYKALGICYLFYICISINI